MTASHLRRQNSWVRIVLKRNRILYQQRLSISIIQENSIFLALALATTVQKVQDLINMVQGVVDFDLKK